MEYPNVTLCDADESVWYNYKLTIPNNEIWYCTTDGKIFEPFGTDIGTYDENKIVSNEYSNGIGKLTFEEDLKMIPTCLFAYTTTVKSFAYPDSIIGFNLFSLFNISMPLLLEERVESKIESLNISKSITSVTAYAVMGLNTLKRITVDEENPAFKMENGCLLSKDGKTIYLSIEGADLPETVEDLSTWVTTMPKITKLNIRKNVETLNSEEYGLFPMLEEISVDEENTKYKSVDNCLLTKDGTTLLVGSAKSEIPSSVTKIGDRSFYSNEKTTSVRIPASVTDIGQYAFCSTPNLEAIEVDDESTNFKSENGLLLSKDGSTLYHAIDKEKITIPDSVTTISTPILYECSKVKEIEFGIGITAICSTSLCFCSSLERVVIPNKVKELNYNLLCCKSLTSVTLSSALTELDWCCDNCPKPTEINVKAKTAPKIGDSAFVRIGNIGTVYYPTGSDYSTW